MIKDLNKILYCVGGRKKPNNKQLETINKLFNVLNMFDSVVKIKYNHIKNMCFKIQFELKNEKTKYIYEISNIGVIKDYYHKDLDLLI